MIELPGWFCLACEHFNGAGKAHRTECRVCGGPPPPAERIAGASIEGLGRDGLLKVIAGLSAEVVALHAVATKAQERGTELLEQLRRCSTG